MRKRNHTESTDCFRGLECYKEGCLFNHPVGFIKKIIECRDGIKCPKSNCSCVHPPEWNWRKNHSCKLFDTCPNKDCDYSHIKNWAWRSNVPCKFTDNCMAFKTGICKFKHNINEIELSKMVEKIVISIVCKHGINCFKKGCFYDHPENWDHRKNTICKFGIKCKNKDLTCEFKHVVLPKKESIEMKEEKTKSEPKKKESIEMKEEKTKTEPKKKEVKLSSGGGEKFKLPIHRKNQTTMEV